jgi:hypothetical protein
MGSTAAPHIPLAHAVPSSDTAGNQQALALTGTAAASPFHVLVCVENTGVRELMRLMLVDAGHIVTGLDLATWLVGDAHVGLRPEVAILDAWPLRYREAVTLAHAQLVKRPAAVVLLADSTPPAHLADQFSAVATLPLLFTLYDLVTAVQQAGRAIREGSPVYQR